MATNWQLVGALEDGGSDWVTVGPLTDGGSLPPYVNEAGGLLRQTLADLNDDLAHGDGTLAFVYGDPSNNGKYIKSGASGEGSWTFIADFATGSSDGNDKQVSADWTVEPGYDYVEADCTAGDVRLTYVPGNGLLAKKCRFRKTAGTYNMIINDGSADIRTEPSNNTIAFRRAFGALVRL